MRFLLQDKVGTEIQEQWQCGGKEHQYQEYQPDREDIHFKIIGHTGANTQELAILCIAVQLLAVVHRTEMPEGLAVGEIIDSGARLVIQAEPGDEINRNEEPAAEQDADQEYQPDRPGFHFQVIRYAGANTKEFLVFLVKRQRALE